MPYYAAKGVEGKYDQEHLGESQSTSLRTRITALVAAIAKA